MFLFTASLRYSHAFEVQMCLIALLERYMFLNGGLNVYFVFLFLKIVTDRVPASRYSKMSAVKFMTVFN